MKVPSKSMKDVHLKLPESNLKNGGLSPRGKLGNETTRDRSTSNSRIGGGVIKKWLLDQSS